MVELKQIRSIIAQGEGVYVEFKRSYDGLSRSVYDTICAFLNRKGGHILLGVKDDGTIEGIREDTLQIQVKTLADDMNNPQIISPVVRLEAEIVKMDEKKIIYIHVPESGQVHTHKGVIYDRNHEGDYKVTNHHLIKNLFVRKYEGYTENRVFSHLKIEDFVEEDFVFVRKRVAAFNYAHPWITMSNDEILRSAKMYLRDERTKEEGYTLAAALTFGKPSALAMTCPHHKIDALCRKYDLDRYDDRDVVDCNLIQAYGRLLSFVRKHTPDRFFLEGDRRISIREVIFREAVANLLVHREYSFPYPARLIIYKNTLVTENWNIPFQMGRITPENMTPHPKNPVIAGVFRELEWVEDLGSGVRNMFRYLPLYVKDKNAKPMMEEGDIFRLTVGYEQEDAQKETPKSKGDSKTKILELIREHPTITSKILASELSLSERHVKKILAQLVLEKILIRIGSRKKWKWAIIENDRSNDRINDGINDGINDTINDTINDNMLNNSTNSKTTDSDNGTSNGKIDRVNDKDDTLNDRVNDKNDRLNDDADDRINDRIKTKHKSKILWFIRENQKVTVKILATELSLSERYVEKLLTQLVSEKVITRAGSRKKGKWTVVENDGINDGINDRVNDKDDTLNDRVNDKDDTLNDRVNDKDDTLNDRVNDKDDTLNDRVNDTLDKKDAKIENVVNMKILELVRENEEITIAEMAQHLSLSVISVKRAISWFVANNIIERKGSRKAGKWVIKYNYLKYHLRYHVDDTLNDRVKIDGDVKIKHKSKILELIHENPKVTAQAMATELTLSERYVRKIMAQLVENKIVERKGSDKDGEWMIIENNDRVK
jgi:ATP-dependent DNA helicase RecG